MINRQRQFELSSPRELVLDLSSSRKRGSRYLDSPVREKAFTLVEMLVVMLILSVCLALVVGISTNVLRDSKDNETHYIQDVVLTALKTYHEANGTWPPENTDNPRSTTTMLRALQGDKDSREKLKMLPRMAIIRNDAGRPVLMDGYGYPMEYFRTGGLGGKSPLLVSQGATLDDLADNINAGLH